MLSWVGCVFILACGCVCLRVRVSVCALTRVLNRARVYIYACVCVCPLLPGAGFVVVVDAARFLPANVTISKVVGTVVSPDGQPLTPPFEVRGGASRKALLTTIYNRTLRRL